MPNGEDRRDDGSALPKHTTPTWEVELLISGVAVFAMLQLPGLLDDALFALVPRFDPQWSAPMAVMYMYFKSVAVILAVTFSLHLLLRAHWIALVGMHSVFPDGARDERLRMGPIQRGVEEQCAAPRGVLIDRADNRATVVFAMGVVMALMLLTVSLMVAVLFLLASGVLWASGIQLDSSWIFAMAALLVGGTFGAARRFDRLWGARLPAGGKPARALAALFRFYRRAGFGRGNSIIALLSSRSGERSTVLLTFAVFIPVMLSVLFGLNGLRHPESIGNYGRFPSGATAALDASHYDSMRQPDRDPAVPFIQDAVVAGPYVRLVVPFLPGRDDDAMRATCPGAAAGDDAAALACLQRLHAFVLDGKGLDGSRYEAGTDPRTNRPALVAMIDVRALRPGRHELRIARTDASARERAAGETDYVIPFWR
jgi:hypothetical protein